MYQLHVGDLPTAQAQEVAATLEELVAEGLIRSYGWSTDDPHRAGMFGPSTHCTAIEHELNVLADASAMLSAELARDGQATLAERMRLLTEHDVRVGEQIALLEAQRAHLQDKIDWYRSQLLATSRR
jgi:aryl-alcohol dehydrogenase-like predicted oxidoreductase